MGCDVTNYGFPDSSLQGILNWVTKKGYIEEEKLEKMIVLSGFPEISYFEEWKEKIVRSVKPNSSDNEDVRATLLWAPLKTLLWLLTELLEMPLYHSFVVNFQS